MSGTKHGVWFSLLLVATLAQSCKKDNDSSSGTVEAADHDAVDAAFAGNINLNGPDNYAAQSKPEYILQDNTNTNPLTDRGATLGRVLFYDKQLSVTNTVSCASCHKQAFAFGDTALFSAGANGATGRHAMRLVNARFAQEQKFFWDERAATLEQQTTQPIQNHAEMGYSGQNGDPGIAVLVAKLQGIEYYRELFKFAFGDETVTEDRMQKALAQFVRSIQSFDSKFDVGLAQVNNVNQPFPNFTATENTGKQLFLGPPPGAPGGGQMGAGCRACHRPPEFDIDPNSRNNGVVGVAGSQGQFDFTVTRAPSLRDLVNSAGTSNGPLMHDGSLANLAAVVEHYNAVMINGGNNFLDQRLRPQGQPQNLQLTQEQKDAIVAFLKTLGGNDVYSNKKWSDPFPR